VKTLLLIALILGGPLAMAFEKPSFELLEKRDGYEIRQYKPYLVAETEVKGEFQQAGNRAFNALFNYISGNNQVVGAEASGSEKISMTVPVNQWQTDEGAYRVSFVVPSKYSLDNVPVPTSSTVDIREVNHGLTAVIRYRGNWSQDRYEEKLDLLIAALASDGQYQPAGKPFFARYNPPMIPGLFRRNEILLPIEAVAAK
jgi:DNA gyrase inhibitor GyrI